MNARFLLAVTLGLYLVLPAPAVAQIFVFDDGGNHIISAPSCPHVFVYDGPFDQPTTVELLNGSMGGEAHVYGHSSFINHVYLLTTLYAYDSSHITSTTGVWYVEAYGDSTVEALVMAGVSAYGNSTIIADFDSSYSWCYVEAYDSSKVTVYGWVGSGVWANDDSVVAVNALIEGSLWASGRANVTVDGEVRGGLSAGGSSNVIISGASIGNIWGEPCGLIAYDNSTVTIAGGWIGGALESPAVCAVGNSTVAIFAGTLGDDLVAGGESNVTISGGSIEGDIYVRSTLAVDGHDYYIDGQSFPYGGTLDSGGQPSRTGTLTCTLTNGGSLSNTFTIYDGGTLVLIPEPATLSLLTLGGLPVLRRRKK